MSPAELAKIIEIRDGLKAAFWDRDAWRWAAKFDQFIRDVQHEQEGASEALGEPKASEPPSPNAREAALRGIEAHIHELCCRVADDNPLKDRIHAARDYLARALLSPQGGEREPDAK